MRKDVGLSGGWFSVHSFWFSVFREKDKDKYCGYKWMRLPRNDKSFLAVTEEGLP